MGGPSGPRRVSREDTPDASRARRPVDARAEWTVPFDTGQCPWQHTIPRRPGTPSPEPGPVAGNPSNPSRDPREPPRRGFRGQPHDAAPEFATPKGIAPERRPSLARGGRLAVRTLPLPRVQVSRWRALSSGSLGKRPPAYRRFGAARRMSPRPDRHADAFNISYALACPQDHDACLAPQEKNRCNHKFSVYKSYRIPQSLHSLSTDLFTPAWPSAWRRRLSIAARAVYCTA